LTLDGQKTTTRNQVKCCDLIGSRKLGTQETLDGLETRDRKEDKSLNRILGKRLAKLVLHINS